MRTGRPVKSDTIYKMQIHVNGTHRYASTQPFTIGEDGKKRYTHKHWGTLDEDLRFHPNTTYLYASIEERSKLIFPKEWDLSELENLESNRKCGRVAYEADDVDRMYGATWLLDRVEENAEKKASMLLTAGFFASKTLGVDFDPLQAKNDYGMRDEQEKCFALQKGPLGQDRLRTWSEESKHGRMFICFVGLILASYVRHIWEENEYLRKNFDSTESILAEMRTIRCIEHTGRMKFVTPFVGAQVKICEAFGFPIPDCCAPVCVSKAKQTTCRRGRPAKPKVEKQTF